MCLLLLYISSPEGAHNVRECVEASSLERSFLFEDFPFRCFMFAISLLRFNVEIVPSVFVLALRFYRRFHWKNVENFFSVLFNVFAWENIRDFQKSFFISAKSRSNNSSVCYSSFPKDCCYAFVLVLRAKPSVASQQQQQKHKNLYWKCFHAVL